MAYNKALDVTLHEELIPGDGKNQDIEIKVCSYSGGPPKLQLTRVDGEHHNKLGRLTQVEVECVRDRLTAILKMQVEPDATGTSDAQSAQGEAPAAVSKGGKIPS